MIKTLQNAEPSFGVTLPLKKTQTLIDKFTEEIYELIHLTEYIDIFSVIEQNKKDWNLQHMIWRALPVAESGSPPRLLAFTVTVDDKELRIEYRDAQLKFLQTKEQTNEMNVLFKENWPHSILHHSGKNYSYFRSILSFQYF